MDKLHVSRGPGYHHYPCADLDGVRGSQDTQQSKITEPGLGPPPPPPFLPGKQNLSCRRGGGSEFFFGSAHFTKHQRKFIGHVLRKVLQS